MLETIAKRGDTAEGSRRRAKVLFLVICSILLELKDADMGLSEGKRLLVFAVVLFRITVADDGHLDMILGRHVGYNGAHIVQLPGESSTLFSI